MISNRQPEALIQGHPENRQTKLRTVRGNLATQPSASALNDTSLYISCRCHAQGTDDQSCSGDGVPAGLAAQSRQGGGQVRTLRALHSFAPRSEGRQTCH